jgi:RNA polymerase sigma-70 factor, ECF subfamily
MKKKWNTWRQDSSQQDIENKIQEELTTNYEKYYRLAYSYVKNEADAMDIVQEGAYKAILNSGQVKEISYINTWIYRIIINEALNYIKKFKKPYTELELVSTATLDTYEDFDLRKALETLKEPDKTIVKLRFFEDMPITEIAAVTDENVNTVKSRLYRSMKKLRILMEE